MIDLSKLKPATDFKAAKFKGKVVPLYLLAKGNMAFGGGMIVRDREFDGCLIEGPAVLLGLEGIRIDHCDLGAAREDVRNILFQPLGDSATGAVGMSNCHFTNCIFAGIGFTGHNSFLNALAKVERPKP